MFGEFDNTMCLENPVFFLKTDIKDQRLLYNRRCGDKTVEKVLNDTDIRFKVHPVEPVNTLKSVSQHLFLEFTGSYTVAPKSASKIYLTCPMEIGVFVARNSGRKHQDWHKLDVFSPHPVKYALYGEVWRGLVCRYWKTPVLFEEPADVNDIGIVRVTLTNRTSKWYEVKKLVIDTQFLKLYFVGNKPVCRVQMDIQDNDTAEITCKDIIRKEHVRAHELLPSKKGPLSIHRNTMEWGF